MSVRSCFLPLLRLPPRPAFLEGPGLLQQPLLLQPLPRPVLQVLRLPVFLPLPRLPQEPALLSPRLVQVRALGVTQQLVTPASAELLLAFRPRQLPLAPVSLALLLASPVSLVLPVPPQCCLFVVLVPAFLPLPSASHAVASRATCVYALAALCY